MSQPIVYNVAKTFDGKYDLIASSPLFKQRATIAFRVVLVCRQRAFINEPGVESEVIASTDDYVVWDEMVPSFPELSKTHYQHGNYCGNDLSLAIKRFAERTAALAKYVPAIEKVCQTS